MPRLGGSGCPDGPLEGGIVCILCRNTVFLLCCMIGEFGIVVFQFGEGHPVRYRVMCGFREGFLYAHHAVCPAPPVARWLMDLSDMSYLEFISGKMCTIFALSDIPVSFNCVPLF